MFKLKKEKKKEGKDDLIERLKDYGKNIHDKKKNAELQNIAQEMIDLTFQPKINAVSRQIISARSKVLSQEKSVFDSLYEQASRKRLVFDNSQ